VRARPWQVVRQRPALLDQPFLPKRRKLHYTPDSIEVEGVRIDASLPVAVRNVDQSTVTTAADVVAERTMP